jgi:hypothetical protein
MLKMLKRGRNLTILRNVNSQVVFQVAGLHRLRKLDTARHQWGTWYGPEAQS